jgi:hypothetical protein
MISEQLRVERQCGWSFDSCSMAGWKNRLDNVLKQSMRKWCWKTLLANVVRMIHSLFHRAGIINTKIKVGFVRRAEHVSHMFLPISCHISQGISILPQREREKVGEKRLAHPNTGNHEMPATHAGNSRR